MHTILDTFAGIGGFSYGLEQSGHYQTAAFCELNPAAQYWLRSRWSGKPIYPDITLLNGKEIISQVGTIDIITGGFPCQDISVVGKREGLGTKEEPTRCGLSQGEQEGERDSGLDKFALNHGPRWAAASADSRASRSPITRTIILA